MRSTFWITLFLAAIFLPGFASLAMADESFSLKKTLKAALYFDPEPKALSRLPSEFMPVHAAQKTADQLAEEADLQDSLALQKELAERPFAEIYYTVSLNSEKMSGLYLI